MTDPSPKPKIAGIAISTRNLSSEELDEMEDYWRNALEDDRLIVSWKWVRVMILLMVSALFVDTFFGQYQFTRGISMTLAFWAGCVGFGKAFR